jgi:hypothetical protein
MNQLEDQKPQVSIQSLKIVGSHSRRYVTTTSKVFLAGRATLVYVRPISNQENGR